MAVLRALTGALVRGPYRRAYCASRHKISICRAGVAGHGPLVLDETHDSDGFDAKKSISSA